MPKIPKPPNGWYSRDVEWHSFVKSKIAKHYKNLAFSTVAAKDLIVALSKENPEASIKDLQALIKYDKEAIKVLQAYIDAGQGEIKPFGYFR